MLLALLNECCDLGLDKVFVHSLDTARGTLAPHTAAVLPAGTPVAATQRMDVRGQLVIPGMIDTHAHVFQHVTGRFGLEADLCGVHSGVTTLIDQGGPSCMTNLGRPAARSRRRAYTPVAAQVASMRGSAS